VTYLIIAGIAIVLIAGFIFWRLGSVSRGMRRANDRLRAELADIEAALARGERMTTGTVREKAERPELRPMLYSLLKHYEKLELFPADLRSLQNQAEAELAYWLCHPNELDDPPDEIEVVREIEKSVDGNTLRLFVLRFRMNEPHWSAKNGWELGVAGPYVNGVPPYSGAGAFSRFRKEEDTSPEEEADWYMDGVTRRS